MRIDCYDIGIEYVSHDSLTERKTGIVGVVGFSVKIADAECNLVFDIAVDIHHHQSVDNTGDTAALCSAESSYQIVFVIQWQTVIVAECGHERHNHSVFVYVEYERQTAGDAGSIFGGSVRDNRGVVDHILCRLALIHVSHTGRHGLECAHPLFAVELCEAILSDYYVKRFGCCRSKSLVDRHGLAHWIAEPVPAGVDSDRSGGIPRYVAQTLTGCGRRCLHFIAFRC